jgi:hypothetical protein
LSIYRFQWPTEVFPCASFHFHKDEGVAVPANDVDLAAAVAAKIAEKNLATVTLQITAR